MMGAPRGGPPMRGPPAYGNAPYNGGPQPPQQPPPQQQQQLQQQSPYGARSYPAGPYGHHAQQPQPQPQQQQQQSGPPQSQTPQQYARPPYGGGGGGPQQQQTPASFGTASGAYGRPPATPTAPMTPTGGRAAMTSSASSVALSAMVAVDVSALLTPTGALVTPLPSNVSKAQILAAIDELEERVNECELSLARARHEASHKGSAHARGASNVRAMSEIVQEVLDDNRDKVKASLSGLGALGEPLAIGAPPLVPLFQLPCDVPGYEENKRLHAVNKFKLARVISERRRATHARLVQLSDEWQSLYKKWAAEHGVRPVTTAPPPAALLHAAAAVSGTETARIALGRASSTVAAAAGGAPGGIDGAFDPAQLAALAAAQAAVAAATAAQASAAVKSEAKNGGDKDKDSKNKGNKYMATVVDVPPMVLDESERARRFLNENNLVADPVAAERERKMRHTWSNEEKRIFIKKYLLYPKQFHKIATFLENRSTADVIEFYFTHKLTFNLKRLLTEHQLKRRRRGDELDASGGRRSSMGLAGAGSSTAATVAGARKGSVGGVQVVTLDGSSGAIGSPLGDDGAAKRKRDDDDTGGVPKKRPD